MDSEPRKWGGGGAGACHTGTQVPFPDQVGQSFKLCSIFKLSGTMLGVPQGPNQKRKVEFHWHLPILAAGIAPQAHIYIISIGVAEPT